MNFLKFVVALNVWYLGLTLAQKIGINDPSCSQDDTDLYANGNLESVFNRMMTRFNETCTPDQCNLEPSAPLEGFLNWDYGGVNFAMRRACEVRRNYKACTVKTTVRHSFELEGIDIFGYIVENEKGVCFPPSCSDEDISILEPNPGQCDPTTMDCEIVSYEVDCPSRTVNANANCASDQLPPTNPFFITRGTRELAIMGDCATLFSGTGVNLGLCTASTGDVQASFTTNFEGFETDPTYVSHKNMCTFQGGQLCLFDMNAGYTVSGSLLEPAINEIIPIEKAGDIILSNEFVQFPRCIAKTCKEEDMEEVLAHHATKFFLDQFGFACDINSPDCNIMISNVNCMTTPAPTIGSTPLPTPDPMPSFNPTQASSTKPSENSSSHPTSTPSTSFVPTETSTLLPTRNPRAKKTFVPTNIPTVEPTSNPRPKKTSMPSKLPTAEPTSNPRPKKTLMPSILPTAEPSSNPTVASSETPTELTSMKPSSNPTTSPSVTSTETPSIHSSSNPSTVISQNPTETASSHPSTHPSESTSTMPTDNVDPRKISSLSPTEASSSTTTNSPVTISSSGFSLSYGNIIITIVTFWLLKWELM